MKKVFLIVVLIALGIIYAVVTAFGANYYKLPNVPGRLEPKGLYVFLTELKKKFEIYSGASNDRVMTYQDLINLGLIDKAGDPVKQVNPYEYGI